jgi:tetratricopeptide (TPR) repeat protein
LGIQCVLAAAIVALTPLAALADGRAQKYYYEDISYPFFALDPARPGWYHNVRPASKESAFPAAKAKGTFRVFVLGGSIASLLYNQDPSIDFGSSLQAVMPTRKVEVMNCGMAGYESFREALLEQEILEYSPDLIVFLTGHNEGIASAPIPIWVMHAQARLSRLGAFRALVKTLHPESDSEDLHSDALSDARDAVFARNLARNISHARARGVEVAVVVPPRNYREPVEVRRMLYDAEFLPGWLRFLKGDYAGARRAWQASLAAGPRSRAPVSEHKAFTWGFIARSEEKLGLPAEARASFEQASVFDRAAICGATCQNIIRRVVPKNGGFLVEADRMFRERAFPRMPGMETFNDRMHWKPQFNCLMSAEIIASLRANPTLGALPWDESRIAALKSSCKIPGGPGTKDDDLRTLSYVLMGLSWPNFSRLSTVSVFYLQAIRQHRPDWFKDVPALMKMTQNPQTQVYGLTMAPDEVILPRFYWHIGEVRLMEHDFAGASRDFSKALQLDPKLAWARLSLAGAEALRGDKKRGLDLLKDAIRLTVGEPEHEAILAAAVAMGAELGLDRTDEIAASDSEYWLKKAEAAMAANDKPGGLAALERAGGLSPNSEQRRRLGQYSLLLGLDRVSTSEAGKEAELWLKKAEAAAASGQTREGVAALDRVRTLSPDAEQLRRVGQYYRIFHETAKFLEVSDALTAANPKDIDVWLMRAEALLMTGRKDDGVEALARAQALAPGPDQLRLIARMRGWVKDGAPEDSQAGGVRDGGRPR